METVVKGKLKSVATMPTYEVCCSQAKEHYARLGEQEYEINLGDTGIWNNRSCGFCNAPCPDNRRVVWCISDDGASGYIPFDLLDIDEGLSPQQE